MKDIYEKLLQTWIMAALQLHNLSKVKEKHWLHIPEITFEIKVVEKATELNIYNSRRFESEETEKTQKYEAS